MPIAKHNLQSGYQVNGLRPVYFGYCRGSL